MTAVLEFPLKKLSVSHGVLDINRRVRFKKGRKVMDERQFSTYRMAKWLRFRNAPDVIVLIRL